MRTYKSVRYFFDSYTVSSKNRSLSIFKETAMILAVTFDLRNNARRYGKALETSRCLAANGLLAL